MRHQMWGAAAGGRWRSHRVARLDGISWPPARSAFCIGQLQNLPFWAVLRVENHSGNYGTRLNPVDAIAWFVGHDS